jgi:hypothetical protein
VYLLGENVIVTDDVVGTSVLLLSGARRWYCDGKRASPDEQFF